jgi:hypothetical protein
MAGRGARRGAVITTVLALCSAPAIAAAQELPVSTTTVPVPTTPPSTVAPPAPFRLPMDSGRKLLDQENTAKADLATARPQLANATAQRDDLQTHWDTLTAYLVRLDQARQIAVSQLGLARERLGASAARAYVNSGSDRIGAALRAVTDTNDIMQARRDLHIISTYGEYEMDQVDSFQAEVEHTDDLILAASRERADVRAQLDAAIAEVNRLQAVIDNANVQLAEAVQGIKRFHDLAATAGSPIIGPNRLTAYQMAEFVRRNGYTPNITVPLDELAQDYLDESAKVGVRGDVAWAQSILETGGFGFAGSMVEPEDNNYAGIGACDSCHRGFRFPDAVTGVRAQMQLLRVYTDKSVTLDSLPDPLVLPGTLRLGFRGKVQSWWDLTGTWATATDYGIRVYELYERMVTETADLVPPPIDPGTPADPNSPGAPAPPTTPTG